jgi:ubiquinol-cytochrome c reductase cytochrome b subunit
LAIVLRLGYGEHTQVDNPTLNRFFSLHYLIPFLILGLVVLHIWALHVPGNNNPVGIDIKKPSKDTVPFHPYITIKDAFALLMFMIIFAGFVFFSPNVLGHSDNYIPANPLVTPAHIVPGVVSITFLCDTKISSG